MNIRNNFLIAIRHIKANKANSIISIAGLIMGLGIVAVIMIFISNEFNYDRSFPNTDHIVRILNYNSIDNNVWANTPFVLGETVKDRFAEVEDCAHQYNIGDIEVEINQEFIPIPDVLSTEASFFRIFSIYILQGNLSDFDNTDNKILLSKSLSHKYFGDVNPVGKQIIIRYPRKEVSMEVAAIFDDLPKNSSIKASMIVNMDFGVKHLADIVKSTGESPLESELKEAWQGIFFTNYLLLGDNTDKQLFESKLQKLGEEYSTANNKLSLMAQPLTDIYFGSSKIVDNNRIEQGNLSMLMILGFIGVLILLIACVNYLNLAAAKAMSSIKGVAVRKVCGASQKNVVNQLIFESVLVFLISLPFAIFVAALTLPTISEMLGKSYNVWTNTPVLSSTVLLAFICFITGMVSGGFIAINFTKIASVNVLRGNISGKQNKQWSRKSMVVFQLAVFIGLMASTLLVQKQVNYAFSKDLGFDKEGLMRVPLGDHNLELYKQEIEKNPNVIGVSGTLWMPPSDNKMYMTIPRVNNHKEMVNVNGLFVDYGFATTMGIKIIMGSDFDKEKVNSGVLVNESAIKTLGLTDILGEVTPFGPVVGVVSDFNMYSLHEVITPMIIGLNPAMSQDIAIRVRTKDLPATMDFLRKTWDNTGGTTKFSFSFTNEILNDIYDSDIRFAKVIGLLAVIAIVIAALGLFGLSILTSKQRVKEIGIRKINGARIVEVMTMLNKDFMKWVGIAFVIATPLAWFAMNRWLQSFAYKTELSWWIFALAGVMALVIALLTVSWQSWKAATRNPVEALRYE